MLREKIYKNKHGVAVLGSYGINTDNRIGGYYYQGNIKIDLPNGKWTAINYYNDPSMYIGYNGGYYCHDKLPAFLTKRNGVWHVGTYEQIKSMVIQEMK